MCPLGNYCPEGSSSGTACPQGTFMNQTGSEKVDDCYICTQGMYCAGYGNEAPDGYCAGGYYCPPGMNVSMPTDYPCPQGEHIQ